MEVTTVLIFCIGITIISLEAIRATISNQPLNVAVNIGESATLNCSGDRDINSWIFQAVNSTEQAILTIGCNLRTGSFKCNYAAVTGSASMDCQLVIRNASSACAGYYTCTDVNLSTRIAMVIVMESEPRCSVDANNNTQVEESTTVELSCSVFYNTTAYLRPQLTWRSRQSNTTSSNTYANCSITVVNPIPVISSDTCTLSFNPPTDPPPETATNAPTYTSNCATPVVFPVYCPINVNITGAENGSRITNGSLLTCSADANPVVSHFQWLLIVCGTETTLDSIASTVPVYVPGSYVCNVTNDLPGCLNTPASLFITSVMPTTTLSTRTTHETSTGFWATSPFLDVNTTDRLGTGGESSKDGLIAVCVCLGISVTINIIVIVMIVVMFRRQRITKQKRADDHVGSVNNRYCEEITAYQNVAQPISIETTGYEHLNPSIDISPYQELADRHTN